MNKLAISLLVLFITLSYAKVLYVSNFGSDDNVGLLPTAPLRTLRAAEAKSIHGDIIQLAQGVYQGEGNCLSFHIANLTLTGPAKLQCIDGIKIEGVNFHAYNLTLPNITINFVDNVTLSNVTLSRGLSAFSVHRLNLTSVKFAGKHNITTFASDFICQNCTSRSEGFISVRRGGFECVSCDLPLVFVNATKPSSFITHNSSFSGVSITRMQSNRLNQLNFRNFGACNISSTNITCEEAGYAGLNLISSNCTVSNSTIEECSTDFNSTNVNATGILLVNSNSTFYNVTVQNNYGNSSVYVGPNSTFTLTNSTITNNWGNDTTLGGGIYVVSKSVAIVSNSTISHNIAFIGGAFYVEEDARMIITNSTFAHNVAFEAGDYACASHRSRAVSIKNCSNIDNQSISGVRNICAV